MRFATLQRLSVHCPFVLAPPLL